MYLIKFNKKIKKVDGVQWVPVLVLVLVLVDMWGGDWWVIEKAVLGMFCGGTQQPAGTVGSV